MSSAEKGGFMRDASAEGIAIIFPDTSPRGAGIEGEQEDWDFGLGDPTLTLSRPVHSHRRPMAAAGWYLDATHPKWTKHYRMFTHVTQELPQVIEAAGLPVVRFKFRLIKEPAYMILLLHGHHRISLDVLFLDTPWGDMVPSWSISHPFFPEQTYTGPAPRLHPFVRRRPLRGGSRLLMGTWQEVYKKDGKVTMQACSSAVSRVLLIY